MTEGNEIDDDDKWEENSQLLTVKLKYRDNDWLQYDEEEKA